MPAIGMLALGAFIGLIATRGVAFASGLVEWQKVMASIVGACFGGLVAGFITKQSRKDPQAIFMYPVGLLLGYTWEQTPSLAAMVTGQTGMTFWLGVLGFAGNVLLTLIALCIAGIGLLGALKDKTR